MEESLGALAHTSMNSLGWELAEEERLTCAIPLAIGLAGASVSIAALW